MTRQHASTSGSHRARRPRWSRWSRSSYGRGRGRWRGPLALVVVGLLVASACGGGGGDDGGGDGAGGEGSVEGIETLGDNIVVGSQEDDAEPQEGGSITVGLESETNSYLPSIFQGSQAGQNVAFSIYDPLIARDAEGELRPYLAESIEPNEDFTEWTLRLRPDVTFHDGTPLNAEALKTIFDDFLLAEGSNLAPALRMEVRSLDVVDELTVRYVLNQPNSAWPDSLTLPTGWPFSPTAAARLGEDFGSQPVGTGPFRFVSWTRDGELVVERNPDYWQEGQPRLDRITFRPIPDDETRATSLESGDIDAAQSIRMSPLLARIAAIPGVEVNVGPGNGGGVVIFNTVVPPFDDVRIRQALTYAVDQQAIIEVGAGESAVATERRTQLFYSGNPYHSEAVAEAWPEHNPERAQELYDEYINDPERSDGRAPGDPVSFTYECTNVPNLVEQATALQGFWEEIGFQVDVQPLEQSAHISGAITGDYEAKCYRMGQDNDPGYVLRILLGDPEAYVQNYTDYNTPVINDAIQLLRSSGDLQERQQAVEEVGLELAREVPYFWTGSDLPFIAYREGVHGVPSWRLPDGSLGDGATPGVTFWGQVWVEG